MNFKRLFALVSLSLLFACSSTPIKVIEFSEFAEIEKGDSVRISWKFENADKVKIKNSEATFNAWDSVFVTPKKSEDFKIYAYQDEGDSVAVISSVKVVDREQEPIPGYKSEFEEKLATSYEMSDYLNGTLTATKLTSPHSLKITRALYPNENEKCILRAVILDEYGNYLSGYSKIKGDINWSAQNTCESEKNYLDALNFEEIALDDSVSLDVAVTFDLSAASKQNQNIAKQIKSFVKYLSGDDNFTFSAHNQNFLQMFALSPKDKALWELENMELNRPNGLNCLYKASYLTLDRLSDGYNEKKICVAIIFNSDNASIVYSANDVAKLSRHINAPVYIIGVGDAIESYNLKYLTNITGGKFYHIFENEISDLKNILLEIYFSQKAYYELKFPFTDAVSECGKIKTKLTFQNYDVSVSDSYSIITRPETQYVSYQALASFDYRDAEINETYYPTLKSLAKVLRDNEDAKVELIGHSGKEGDAEECLYLSEKRAESVKRKLIGFGAKTNQIKTKGMGSRKPLYYFGNKNWQQRYNRRVEVRWLDPSLKPYEISAAVYETEEMALNAVEYWEKNGYKAYYERYIINEAPKYQVKIWGFGAKKDAVEIAKKLRNEYNGKFVVE